MDATGTMDTTEARIREACEHGDYPTAAGIVVSAYGQGVRAYVRAWLHDRSLGDEAFGMFQVDLMTGLKKFRWNCQARSFAYVLAHNAAQRLLRRERVYVEMSDAALSALVAPVDTRTESYLKTDFKQRARALRERLCLDDQALLMLRVDRDLGFNEIAAAFLDRGLDESDHELERKSTCLRQRFRQVKMRLEKLAREDGLIPPRSE